MNDILMTIMYAACFVFSDKGWTNESVTLGGNVATKTPCNVTVRLAVEFVIALGSVLIIPTSPSPSPSSPGCPPPSTNPVVTNCVVVCVGSSVWQFVDTRNKETYKHHRGNNCILDKYGGVPLMKHIYIPEKHYLFL